MQTEFETSRTPDSGWMGDPRRGASLGRASRDAATIAESARADIAMTEQTIADLRGGFVPGWWDAAGNFTPNFPTPESLDSWIEGLEAKMAARRADLATAESALAETGPKFHLRRVRLDSGGYDSGGAYWGHGKPLYEAFTDSGADYMTLRASSRDSAKLEVIEDYPAARFFR